VEELQSPEEIASHYGFDVKLVREIAIKVDHNEYKRQQSAPGLKLTSKALRIGRPFPIAQKFAP
jgi:NAD+ synthase (glutamine-hydrolysing)